MGNLLPLCLGQVQVHIDLTVLPYSSVVVLEESLCPRGSSRTNFQVLVLVLVLESQVLDNNAGCRYAEIAKVTVFGPCCLTSTKSEPHLASWSVVVRPCLGS